jgi:aquaporin Z
MDNTLVLKSVAELVGTFVFFSVIRNVASFGALGPYAVGSALVGAILFGGAVSGGHFNPGVTLMQTYNGDMDAMSAVYYVAAQLLGAFLALSFQKSWQHKALLL